MASKMEIVTKTKYGSFTVLKSEEGIGRELANGNHWGEKIVEFLKANVAKESAFIDIGAHIGTISVPMASHCKMVYSFEPQSVIYNLLLTNCKLNNISNIKAFNQALGHKACKTTMARVMPDGSATGKEINYESDTLYNFGGLPLGEGGETTIMETLDSLKIANVGAIKVDVEGAEPLVFYGAQETIALNKPIIVFESNYKRITDEMRRSLQLPSEVEKFDIIAYTKSLGYQPPLEIDGGDYILVPKYDMSLILNAKFATPAGGTATFYKLGGHCYVMMFENKNRGPYTVHSLADNQISVNFDGYRIEGQLSSKEIAWSNGTTWTTK